MVEAGNKKKNKSSKPKDDDMDEPQAEAEGAMITSLCWVGQGFAKALIDEDENMEEHVAQHSRMIKKLAQ